VGRDRGRWGVVIIECIDGGGKWVMVVCSYWPLDDDVLEEFYWIGSWMKRLANMSI